MAARGKEGGGSNGSVTSQQALSIISGMALSAAKNSEKTAAAAASIKNASWHGGVASGAKAAAGEENIGKMANSIHRKSNSGNIKQRKWRKQWRVAA